MTESGFPTIAIALSVFVLAVVLSYFLPFWIPNIKKRIKERRREKHKDDPYLIRYNGLKEKETHLMDEYRRADNAYCRKLDDLINNLEDKTSNDILEDCEEILILKKIRSERIDAYNENAREFNEFLKDEHNIDKLKYFF